MKLTAAKQAKIEKTCCRYLDSLGYVSPVHFIMARKEHETWKHEQAKIQEGWHGRSSRFAGVCYRPNKEKEIAVIYLNVKISPTWAYLDDTIRHEILHLVRKYNHYSEGFTKCMMKLKQGKLTVQGGRRR